MCLSHRPPPRLCPGLDPYTLFSWFVSEVQDTAGMHTGVTIPVDPNMLVRALEMPCSQNSKRDQSKYDPHFPPLTPVWKGECSPVCSRPSRKACSISIMTWGLLRYCLTLFCFLLDGGDAASVPRVGGVRAVCRQPLDNSSEDILPDLALR